MRKPARGVATESRGRGEAAPAGSRRGGRGYREQGAVSEGEGRRGLFSTLRARAGGAMASARTSHARLNLRFSGLPASLMLALQGNPVSQFKAQFSMSEPRTSLTGIIWITGNPNDRIPLWT